MALTIHHTTTYFCSNRPRPDSYPHAPAPRPHSTRTAVIAHGILDSYRRERGIPVPGQDTAVLTPPATSTAAPPSEASCSKECVRVIESCDELDSYLDSVSPESLVVLDLYKTSCGACKYIQPGFVKLCMASADDNPAVAFLKHNIMDDEFELTDIAGRFEVKAVPLFLFFKGGQVIDRFATREKSKIAEAINRHTQLDIVDV